jgi:hypothetical protein
MKAIELTPYAKLFMHETISVASALKSFSKKASVSQSRVIRLAKEIFAIYISIDHR